MIEHSITATAGSVASRVSVNVINVTKKFGDSVAAKNINLRIGEGEFFSFLGPSGCGKTTLLRMIAGFETPTEGNIQIAGIDMRGVPPHKRNVNMVFQNYALFPHLTIGQNVAFGLKSSGKYNHGEIEKRVKDSLDLVRLGQLIDRFPNQLSGGQQQRAALARAVINNPSVLLLDEPLSALDPQIREEMQVELLRLQKRLGMTFIMVTHDQNEALALSNRIAVFCQGNLEQVGTPEEVFEHPSTKFVARFIGQTNLLPGIVTSRTDSACLISLGGGSNLTIQAPSLGVKEGDELIVWVKPHGIQLIESSDDLSESAASNALPVLITSRMYQGTTTEFLTELENGNEVRVSCSNISQNWMKMFNIGDRALLLIPSAACAVLD